MTRKKLILIIVLAAACVVVPIIIFFARSATTKAVQPLNSAHTVIIDNVSSYDSGLNSTIFAGIETSAYASIGLNIKNEASVYHGTIRDSSFKYLPDSSVSFILDVPSVKLSWSVLQALDSSGNPISDALVKCVDKADIVYTTSTSCIDITDNIETSAEKAFDPILQDLPLTGFTYSVTYGQSPDKTGGYALFITYYTSTGQQDALTALQSLGFDPSDYEIIYTDGTTPAS